MDTITILRELVRLRRFVIGVAVFAVLVGAMVMFKLPSLTPRHHDVGYATTQILVDTPSSQVVDVSPKGSDTLGQRANVLASLIVDGVVKSQIVRYAGLKPNQLHGVSDAATLPTTGSGSGQPLAPLPTPSGSNAFILTTHALTDASNDPLPIIQIDAQAPTRAAAARLAQATINGLHDYLKSTAAIQRIPDAQQLHVDGLGVPSVTTQSRGPSNLIVLLAVVVSFVLGCAGVLGVARLVRRWHAAEAAETASPPRPAAPAPETASAPPAPEPASAPPPAAPAPGPALDIRRRVHDEPNARSAQRHLRPYAAAAED
jgi:multisubunit Na+/H+ antiporter MnhG subunit